MIVYKIKAVLKTISNTYDIGSYSNFDMFVYKNKCYYTSIDSGFEIRECSVEDLGNEIALYMMLKGLSTPNFYGSWLQKSKLAKLEEIAKWNQEDIEFNLEIAKLWEMARVVCNTNPDTSDKITFISYSEEAGDVWFEEIPTEEELDNFIIKYCYDKMS